MIDTPPDLEPSAVYPRRWRMHGHAAMEASRSSANAATAAGGLHERIDCPQVLETALGAPAAAREGAR